jgi:hypothetical protein
VLGAGFGLFYVGFAEAKSISLVLWIGALGLVPLLFLVMRPIRWVQWLVPLFVFADLALTFGRATVVHSEFRSVQAGADSEPFWIQPRTTVTHLGLDRDHFQAMRYPEVVKRVPVWFSAPFRRPDMGTDYSAYLRGRSEGLEAEVGALLSGGRWNSFHLLREYFDVLHPAGQAPDLVRKFRIGQPPITVENGTLDVHSSLFGWSFVVMMPSGGGKLALNGMFDRHWSMWINGSPIPLGPGLVTDTFNFAAGRSAVQMTYWPSAFAWATVLKYLVFLAVMIIVVKNSRKIFQVTFSLTDRGLAC